MSLFPLVAALGAAAFAARIPRAPVSARGIGRTKRPHAVAGGERLVAEIVVHTSRGVGFAGLARAGHGVAAAFARAPPAAATSTPPTPPLAPFGIADSFGISVGPRRPL